MLLVAVGWIYVVLLMALTEPTILAGISVLLFYCVLPLGLLIYLSGTRQRRARRRAGDWAAHLARHAAQDGARDKTKPED